MVFSVLALMKISTPVGFIAELPSILSGKSSLNAIFSTYNSVGNYKSGPMNVLKPGLQIVISNGKRDEDKTAFASAIMASASGILSRMEASNEIERIACTEAAVKVQEKFSDLSGNVFAAVYAGVNAPEESLEFVKKIRRVSPTAYVVVVTCDCGMQYKQTLFKANSKIIDILVVTPICGGRTTMGSILDALIDLWPQGS